MSRSTRYFLRRNSQGDSHSSFALGDTESTTINPRSRPSSGSTSNHGAAVPPACRYIIDPDGDVIVAVTNPNAPFLAWDESGVPPPRLRRVKDRRLFSPVATEAPGSSPAQDASAYDERPIKRETTEGPQPAEGPQDEGLETFLASSRHLSLASNILKTTISKSHQARGYRRIVVHDHDPAALHIVLDILHCHNRRVPRTVTLETLAKIAAIVDQYRLHEAVELFSQMWVGQLKHDVPDSYCRDSLLWLCVATVFDQPDIVRQVEDMAVLESFGPMWALDLPIKGGSVNEIDKARQDALGRLFAGLHKLRDDLTNDRTEYRMGCNFVCRSIQLGLLVKNLSLLGLLDALPKEPYPGYSVGDMVSVVRELPSPNWEATARRGPRPQAANVAEYGAGAQQHFGHVCPFARLTRDLLTEVEVVLKAFFHRTTE